MPGKPTQVTLPPRRARCGLRRCPRTPMKIAHAAQHWRRAHARAVSLIRGPAVSESVSCAARPTQDGRGGHGRAGSALTCIRTGRATPRILGSVDARTGRGGVPDGQSWGPSKRTPPGTELVRDSAGHDAFRRSATMIPTVDLLRRGRLSDGTILDPGLNRLDGASHGCAGWCLGVGESGGGRAERPPSEGIYRRRAGAASTTTSSVARRQEHLGVTRGCI